MTVILVNDHKLHGDRRVQSPGSVWIAKDGSKIFTSSDKQYAFGISGTLPNQSLHTVLEGFIRSVLEALHIKMVLSLSSKYNLQDLLEGADLKEYKDFPLILAATKTFHATILPEIGVVYSNPHDHPASIGSGDDRLLGQVMAGMSVKQAYKKTSEVEPMTGDVYDTIFLLRLKDFHIGGGK